MQNGPVGGQSVPHVHVHILPINYGDLDFKDDIYDRLEEWAPRADRHPSLQKLDVTEENARRDQMVKEIKEEGKFYQRRLVVNIAFLN